ncbi:HD-GYP domain-containing protein [Algisphaera agarilytica]|uniref:Putative nucleotidyltransferase with HDIG domain n=1 Tax=Algisphaera agarilytica TaxID=1385975 RepID=A0A7X0LLW6_9BACT|nr:HD-GYP domain-containing protein [Algisphaera agarilytica]MBB6431447.1 putative nucleotidyltransferase with HDIG domain [Algisphaera agarilytica]
MISDTSEPARQQESGTPGEPQAVLQQIEEIAHLAAQINRESESAATASLQQYKQLRVLEQVIDGLAVHTDNDELLADAMEQVAMMTGSAEVWVVEATEAGALGMVHMLGEVVVGESDLPLEIAALCESVFYQQPHPSRLRMTLADGKTATAMPILMHQRFFGSLVFTTSGASPISDELRDRLLHSILRYVAISLENRHFIESLNEMIVEVVCGFSLAIESRDSYTGGHVQRVTAYAVALAQALGMSDEDQSIVRLGGLLHDIGKVAIPDDILNKAEKLTPEEFDIIKVHPVVGHEILKRIPHLDRANQIVRHHHERWDGQGYPDKLAGQQIPVLSRVLAIADSYDAMTSDRSYRETKTHEEAMDEIRQCAGTQFDPEMAEVFCRFSEPTLAKAGEIMHEWIQSKDHSNGLSIDQLIAMKKPRLPQVI